MDLNKNAKILTLLVLSFITTNILNAQDSTVKKQQFIISLKDKTGTPFTIDHPESFLSPRAIERRQRLQIPINEEDLPLNPSYRDQISQIPGVHILYTSRWFNNLTIELDTTITSTQVIRNLPFVKSIDYIGGTPIREQKDTTRTSEDYLTSNKEFDYLRLSYHSDRLLSIPEYYGKGWEQIQMLSGHVVHKEGYTGAGILIAMLDVGYQNYDRLPIFDSLMVNNRIIAYNDFVDFNGSVWEDGSHGTNALSCIAANVPGVFVGTAPEAYFVLVRTENEGFESRIEESNWLAGAEYADSIGADLISSSLGYTTFSENEFSHTYSDMNGKTTVITLAADKAYEKGIIVMNSAGNEGYSPWHYIGAPADGEHVVAAGGVDEYMYPSTFSSYGPTSDNRIKPNISALATDVIVAESNGDIGPSNGTSFSNPILSGMMACMLQACPDKTLDQILDAVYRSGSHYATPNSRYGYGVPHFEMALAILGKLKNFDPNYNHIFENEIQKGFALATLRLYSAYVQKVTITLKKQTGHNKFSKIVKTKVKLKAGDFYSTPWLIDYLQKKPLKKGYYIIEIKSDYMNYQRLLSVGG